MALPIISESLIKGAGRGVFAAKEYQPGEFICFYEGRKMLKRDSLVGSSGYDRSFDRDYLIRGNPNPKSRLGVGPIINDSHCLPQDHHSFKLADATVSELTSYLGRLAAAHLYTKYSIRAANVREIRRGNRLITVATRVIKPGEELLTFYGYSYWTRMKYLDFPVEDPRQQAHQILKITQQLKQLISEQQPMSFSEH